LKIGPGHVTIYVWLKLLFLLFCSTFHTKGIAMRRSLCVALCSFVLFVSPGAALLGQDVAPPAAEKAKPATAKVETGKFVVETTLKGTIAADDAAELRLNLKAWLGPYAVKAAVPHGARVKKGQVVMELDTTKIDIAIREARLDREIAETAFKQLKGELPILEKLLPINLAAAERDKRIADEDLKRYNDVEREQAKKSAAFGLESQQHRLEYAMEELKQLQQMYRDKDLTEETEEIILKRQKHQIEQLEFYLASQKVQHERQMQLDMPRRDQQMQDAADKAALAQQRSAATLPLELEQKKLALRKAEAELAKVDERFKNLESDRSSMILLAPSDGIAGHGSAERGQWNTATISNRLKPQGTVQANEVVMTIAADGARSLLADVNEADLHLLKEGLTGQATPTGFPNVKLPARLASLSSVPRTGSSYEAQVALEVPAGTNVAPGMTATAKFVAYRKDDALLVPSSAVFKDDGSDASYVLVKTDGEPTRTEVRTGHSAGGKTEILDGVKAGTEILTAKP
jgi:multidrug efflux pump subunit AcrA (membrane-fusion protein)